MTYSSHVKKLLTSSDAKEGCKVILRTGSEEFEGTLMPHHDFSDPDVVVLKLKSGYNIGIKAGKDASLKVIDNVPQAKKKEKAITPKKGLPNLVLIGTGGTIASFVDYRTGAVQPALSAASLVDSVPEIRDIANIGTRILFSIFSENMDVSHWQELAKAATEEINAGANGIIIPHGTDTMGYTAAALSFMLKDLSVPVVLVGAQRSSDRPSSDAYSNLIAAARFCASGPAGVFVVMHNDLNDNSFAVHVGTRVRKMHSSRRDAFKSINIQPAALIDESGSVMSEIRPTGKRTKATARTDLERKVVLLQYYPGMDSEMFRNIFKNSKGVVISGSGLGHVNSNIIPMIADAVSNGTVVVMTTQCLYGSTNMNIYATGRDLIDAGVISVKDMLPETAYVKLMWALANSKDTEEAKTIMRTTIADEMGDRRLIQ